MQLDHPYIVKLVRTFRDEERLYFLLEFVKGLDLFDVIKQLNILDVDQAKFYVACMLLMVKHMHEKKIIFRDLKPENIMIAEDGYPKLIDFGTAKMINGRTYTVVGTPHYIAPEIISGKGYGFSVDCYSIGVMLYEFLCGHVPFGEDEEDPFVVYQKVLQHRLVFPDFLKNCKASKDVINLLLDRNPALRRSSQIIAHSWFRNCDWEALLLRKIEPPFKPSTWRVDKAIERAKKCGHLIDLDDVIQVESLNLPPRDWDTDF